MNLIERTFGGHKVTAKDSIREVASRIGGGAKALWERLRGNKDKLLADLEDLDPIPQERLRGYVRKNEQANLCARFEAARENSSQCIESINHAASHYARMVYSAAHKLDSKPLPDETLESTPIAQRVMDYIPETEEARAFMQTAVHNMREIRNAAASASDHGKKIMTAFQSNKDLTTGDHIYLVEELEKKVSDALRSALYTLQNHTSPQGMGEAIRQTHTILDLTDGTKDGASFDPSEITPGIAPKL